MTDEHCFQDYKRQPVRYVYVEMLSNAEIAVAFGDGACPPSIPADIQVFYR